jgi:hypothetical protein
MRLMDCPEIVPNGAEPYCAEFNALTSTQTVVRAAPTWKTRHISNPTAAVRSMSVTPRQRHTYRLFNANLYVHF